MAKYSPRNSSRDASARTWEFEIGILGVRVPETTTSGLRFFVSLLKKGCKHSPCHGSHDTSARTLHFEVGLLGMSVPSTACGLWFWILLLWLQTWFLSWALSLRIKQWARARWKIAPWAHPRQTLEAKIVNLFVQGCKGFQSGADFTPLTNNTLNFKSTRTEIYTALQNRPVSYSPQT